MAVFLIEYPWASLLPATIFFGFFYFSRKKPALLAGLAWILYLVYELGMKHRILCGGECNIRLDLFLIYPALLIVSARGIWKHFSQSRNAR